VRVLLPGLEVRGVFVFVFVVLVFVFVLVVEVEVEVEAGPGFGLEVFDGFELDMFDLLTSVLWVWSIDRCELS